MTQEKNSQDNHTIMCVWKRNLSNKIEGSYFALHCENCDGFGNIYPDYENMSKCERYSTTSPPMEIPMTKSIKERDESLYFL